jgi:polyhydroxyalkanoate synthesis regulator phasin
LSDLISKALFCSLGFASLTKDAIRKTAEDLVNQSQITEEEGRKLVKDWQRRSVDAERALEKKVETAVHKVLKNLGLSATHQRPKNAKAAGKGAGKGRRRAGKAKAAAQ